MGARPPAGEFYFLGPSTLLSTIFRASPKASAGVKSGFVVASLSPYVYCHNKTRLARQIETMEVVGLGLEDHGLRSSMLSDA